MTDQYLQEQHAYSIAQNRPVEPAPVVPEPDERTSWVMLSQTGEIVRLPHEHIRHNAGSRIGLDISVPRALQGQTEFSLRSDTGTAYITTKRVIYIPSKPTEEFKSFAAPILSFQDSYISSPWFGAWYWAAIVKPVSQGGIPPDIVRVEVKLTFRDGGHNEFRQRFEELKERLHHAQEIERETGQRLLMPDEPLPAYEARQSRDSSSTTNPAAPARADSSTSRGRAPNEPPPDYEEAQAQSLSMRLEDVIRDEADHN